MWSYEQFKFKVEVLKTTGYTLITPLAALILHFILTGSGFDATLLFRLVIAIVAARIGYEMLCKAFVLTGEIDAKLNRPNNNRFN